MRSNICGNLPAFDVCNMKTFFFLQQTLNVTLATVLQNQEDADKHSALFSSLIEENFSKTRTIFSFLFS